MGEFFDSKPAPPIERLARIEGQSNFLSLLAGIEAGPDTTEDMGALAFSRFRGGVPEALEAYVAQSDIYKRPLMSMLFREVVSQLRPKESDYQWIRGAIADAFLLVQKGQCKPIKQRAKSFRVGHEVYSVMRSVAWSVFWECVDRSERAWLRSRSPRAVDTQFQAHSKERKP